MGARLITSAFFRVPNAAESRRDTWTEVSETPRGRAPGGPIGDRQPLGEQEATRAGGILVLQAMMYSISLHEQTDCPVAR